MSETLELITSLATQGYSTVADSFSKIITETIRKHGDVQVLAKMKASALVKRLSSEMYALINTQRMEDLIDQVEAIRGTIWVIFPQPGQAPISDRPGPILLGLIELAKQYCTILILAKETRQGVGDPRRMQAALQALQQTYDIVKTWEAFYPIIEVLKEKNNIVTIGMLITSMMKEQEMVREKTRIIMK